MVLMRWGLIPFVTKQISDMKGISTINTRAESITKSSTWGEPVKKRRCLVSAWAFYEWKQIDAMTTQPYSIGLSDSSMFAFAAY
jgi:putative SOS response-associated peptidase YedK